MTAPKTFEEQLASLPEALEPAFVMSALNEPVRLASGQMTLSRDGNVISQLQGELELNWLPTLSLDGRGVGSLDPREFAKDAGVQLAVPSVSFVTDVHLTSLGTSLTGDSNEVGFAVHGGLNLNLASMVACRFYLVRFPDYIGDAVRSRTPRQGWRRDRVTASTDDFTCVVDAIDEVTSLQKEANRGMGFAITHVGELRFRDGQARDVQTVAHLLDALYWLFGFVRGARTGPILPHDSLSPTSWVGLFPWIVDEPRGVHTWLPDRSPVCLDDLAKGFFAKWADPIWEAGLRSAFSWYFAANAPSAASEVRLPISQIALQVLASLSGYESGKAHEQLRGLLTSLAIPVAIPGHMQELAAYAASERIDGPECLTRIRNKLEHPTARNRGQLSRIDGLLRLQAGQLALEFLELTFLAVFGYGGKHARRAYRGWKGDDEVPVPWKP